MSEGTAHPGHEVAAGVVGDDLAAMLAKLRDSRPAAFAVGLAALQLGIQDPDALLAYLDARPAPGPEAADDDLYAWAAATGRFQLWLATEGQDAVRTEVDLAHVDIPRQ